MTKPSGRPPHRDRARTQTPRHIVRVLTEGRRTEPDYLSGWKRHNAGVHLDFAETGMTPDALVRRAKEHVRRQPRKHAEREFDEIWCVFDTDAHKNLQQAMEDARQSGIRVAVSNPCFELWLVLHVQDQNRHIDRHAVQRLSKQLGLSDGKRIAEAAKNTLIDHFQDAKQRAQALDELHFGNNSPDRSNPSTDVWRLVDQLRDGT